MAKQYTLSEYLKGMSGLFGIAGVLVADLVKFVNRKIKEN